jgi:hypothetical protein
VVSDFMASRVRSDSRRPTVAHKPGSNTGAPPNHGKSNHCKQSHARHEERLEGDSASVDLLSAFEPQQTSCFTLMLR